MASGLVSAIYLLCIFFFVLSLSGLSQHVTARRGNVYGIVGMTLAILFTFLQDDFANEFAKFFTAFLIGGAIGLVLALKVSMINMP
jgi:NAD(P) transhydrogenase subunit beta